jgi:hypothetical protein
MTDAHRQGVFMLVDVDGRRLRFYSFKQAAINRTKDALKGRVPEMVDFLIKSASVRSQRGETK